MAHEEQNRGAKLSKQLKVPQRGMGVAQLEKIILEEKVMKDVSVLPYNPKSFRPNLAVLLPPDHRHLVMNTDAISMNHGFLSMPNDQNRDRVPRNLGGLPYEPNTHVCPLLPNVTHRLHFQQSCSSSMMNFQMEPPSNQSYCIKKYSSVWPVMVGMKRSYPFSIENMPIPSFKCKFPPVYAASISRSDESTSCSNISSGTVTLEPPNKVFRESSLSLGVKTGQTTKKLIDEDHGLTKDFLTLAPPKASRQSHSSSDEDFSPYQGETSDPCEIECSNQQQTFHTFFPAARIHGNISGEAGEQVDLSLKL